MRFCFLCEKLKLYIDIINKVGYYLSKTNGRKALLYTISTLMLKYKSGSGIICPNIYGREALYYVQKVYFKGVESRCIRRPFNFPSSLLMFDCEDK